MKQAKIMLSAIAIFAVVGGALAFKAKSAFGTSFITTSTPGACSVLLKGKKVSDATTPFYYYTTPGSTLCPTANYTQITSQE
jgi:hypothetical protein